MASGDRRRAGISRRRMLARAREPQPAASCWTGAARARPTAPRNPEVNGVDADLLDEVFMLENMSIAAYAHIAGSLTGECPRAWRRRSASQEASTRADWPR